MYLKKQDALTKWCPMAMTVQSTMPSSFNRDSDGKIPHGCNCIAGECMMWRSHQKSDDEVGYCGLADNLRRSLS